MNTGINDTIGYLPSGLLSQFGPSEGGVGGGGMVVVVEGLVAVVEGLVVMVTASVVIVVRGLVIEIGGLAVVVEDMVVVVEQPGQLCQSACTLNLTTIS